MEVQELKLDRICRLCLEEKCGQLLNVFRNGSTLCENILRVTAIKIQEGDGLPVHVCQQCVSLVNVIINFQRKCIVADLALHHYVRKCFCHKEYEATKAFPDPLQLMHIIKTEGGQCHIKTETSVFPQTQENKEEFITGIIEDSSTDPKVSIKLEEADVGGKMKSLCKDGRCDNGAKKKTNSVSVAGAKNSSRKVHRRKRKGRGRKAVKSHASGSQVQEQKTVVQESDNSAALKRKDLQPEPTIIKKQKTLDNDRRYTKLVIHVEGDSLCCSQCSSRFREVEELKSHLVISHNKRVIRWHTVVGPGLEHNCQSLLCASCGQQFTSLDLFNVHQNQKSCI